jgi:hypothetical protein
MPYYEITQTQLDGLKDAIKTGQIMGVGMLSHFLDIHIDNSWENEDVVIASMYFPDDDYCTFYFPRKRAYIVDGEKTRFDLPGRRTQRERYANRF